MGTLRAILRDYRRLAFVLVALSLMVKALVPAGFMLSQQGKVLTVLVCADTQGRQLTRQIVIPHSGEEGDAGGEHRDTGGVCAFSSLATGSLANTDMALLAIALVFILALGFAQVRPLRLERILHLRPPLRGPPVLA
jgi:hypothetical protein